MSTKVVRYSEAFKLQIIQEIEQSGILIGQVQLKYGIKGTGTISKWIKKYGKLHLLPKVIRVEKPNEKDQIKAMKEEIQRLKAALADKELDYQLEKAFTEIMAEDYGVDLDAFKKKADKKLSAGYRKRRKD
jgi:transposase